MAHPLDAAQLVDAVADIVDLLVLSGLLEERRDVDLREIGAAREVDVGAQRGLRILPAEQAGPVAGQLRLPEPLAQRGDRGAQGEGARRDERDGRLHVQQAQQQGAQHCVAG